MPDNKNQNQNQGGNRKQQSGNKGSTQIERENANTVGNDNDMDRDLEREGMQDRDDEAITQRSPRQGDQSQQGQRQVDRGGAGGVDRERDRE